MHYYNRKPPHREKESAARESEANDEAKAAERIGDIFEFDSSQSISDVIEKPHATERARPPLDFDAATHIYRVEGEVYPSITQVIEAAGLVDYSYIPPEELPFYQDRGTALHRACWFDDENDLNPESVDAAIVPRLKAWRRLRSEIHFEIVQSESPRYDRIYRFAGTPDRLVRLLNGTLAVVEIKSGALQAGVALQLAAQAHLFRLEHQGAHLKRFAVQLKADESYVIREFPEATEQRDLTVFLSALTCYRWRKQAFPGKEL